MTTVTDYWGKTAADHVVVARSLMRAARVALRKGDHGMAEAALSEARSAASSASDLAAKERLAAYMDGGAK